MSTSKNETINKFNADGNRDGWWEIYYSNGQLNYKGNYINGKFDGWWESYHPNGQLCSKGNYIKGKEDGWWEEYNVEGELNKNIFYVNI